MRGKRPRCLGPVAAFLPGAPRPPSAHGTRARGRARAVRLAHRVPRRAEGPLPPPHQTHGRQGMAGRGEGAAAGGVAARCLYRTTGDPARSGPSHRPKAHAGGGRVRPGEWHLARRGPRRVLRLARGLAVCLRRGRRQLPQRHHERARRSLRPLLLPRPDAPPPPARRALPPQHGAEPRAQIVARVPRRPRAATGAARRGDQLADVVGELPRLAPQLPRQLPPLLLPLHRPPPLRPPRRRAEGVARHLRGAARGARCALLLLREGGRLRVRGLHREAGGGG